MPVVTFDVGGTPIAVECQRAGKAAPRRPGDKTTAFLGAEDAHYRGSFMVVPLILAPKTPAEAAAIRALFALGAQVPCSGSVFNNAGATVICSGKISDDLSQSAAWWTINLTLYEVGSVADYSPATITLYLTHVAAGGGVYVASTDAADDPFSAGLGSVTIMDAPEVIPTCGSPMSPNPAISCTVGTSASPERVWESLPAPADGLLVGAPYLQILSIGGTADCWSTQHVGVHVFLVRGGVDIVEFDTGWSNGNGGFSGSFVTATAPAVVIEVEAGDTLRVELYGQAGLHSGYASDGTLQVVTHGNGGGGSHYAYIVYRGTALFE